MDIPRLCLRGEGIPSEPMRKVFTAAFCASLLILMLLPTAVYPDSDLDEAVVLENSGNPVSSDALAWEWANKAGDSSGDDRSNAIAVHSNGDVYVTGAFESTVTFGDTTLTSSGNDDIFVAKMNNTGYWLWALSAGGLGVDIGNAIDLDQSGNVFLTGKFQGTAQFGTDSISSAQNNDDDLFVAKISAAGVWQWVTGAASHPSGTDDCGKDIVVDSAGDAYVTGNFRQDIDFDSTTLTWAGLDDIFVAKINTWGNWQWATMAGSTQGNDHANSIAIGPNGDLYITGNYQFTANFGNISLTTSNGIEAFVAKMSSHGDWVWSESMGGMGTDEGHSVVVDSQGAVFVSGIFYSEISIGNMTFTGGGNSNSFIAKAHDLGSSVVWDWAKSISSSSANYAGELVLDSNEDLILTGGFLGTTIFGNKTMTSSGNKDVFVTKILSNGDLSWAQKAGSGSEDMGVAIGVDSLGNLYVSGYFFGSTISFGNYDLASSGGFDGFVAKMSTDYDQDSVPDSLDTDDDGDLILDEFDDCKSSPIGFLSQTSTDLDGDGCRDSDEDLDDDGDGLLDVNDACPRGWTDWVPNNVTDIDMDGCYDASEDLDDDNDGFEDFIDKCPIVFGNSTYPFEKGCPDRDGDTRPDVNDPFPDNPLEWEDSDRDGVGNNSDAFPYDATQTQNQDGDQYGDNPFGNLPDTCPDEYGTSVKDVYGCPDSDGDGISDINDQFPNDPEVWQDSDGDGIEDGLDDFPYNPTQSIDSDGDGFGDNPMGSNADRFVDDETQWSDVDGDGYGDNPNGSMPDAFPLDPTQWMDSDGDGYGDNPSGNMPDAFPLDPTQWIDGDNDGLGDNPDGNNPDPHLFDSDNDGYNNSIDPLPFYATPGDLDNDGWLDDEDWDPDDSSEWADFDEDGIGNNEDNDDDGDNWGDWAEMRAGTDPYDENDYPAEGFELSITDNIALSAWDLLALASGLPLASWLIFGFVTRNARTDAFELRMREAKTREELEEVATEYERALMIRLIGPHQGIRLERVRAELDDEIEMSEAELTGQEDDLGPVVTSPDQTDYTEEELGLQPPEDAEIIVDEKGYEWVDEGEDKWYRHSGENSWIKWET